MEKGGNRLVAELRGNLPAILELEEKLYNRGAGSPFPMQPSTVIDRRIVA